MRFTPRQAAPFDSPNIRGFSYSAYEESPEMSAAVLEVRGWHGMVKSASSRCFHVLEGSGLFLVSGTEHRVEEGDVVIVPRGEPHDFTGEMRLFVVHSPAYRKDDVKRLE